MDSRDTLNWVIDLSPNFPPPPPPLSLDPDDSSFEPGQASLDRRPFNATFFRVYPRRQFIRRKEDDSLEIYKSGIAEIRVVIYYREQGKEHESSRLGKKFDLLAAEARLFYRGPRPFIIRATQYIRNIRVYGIFSMPRARGQLIFHE